jgi:hypothetical protein
VLLLELLKGLASTGQHLFTKKITVFYPEEKTPQSGRFRSLHALRRYPDGEEEKSGVLPASSGLSRVNRPFRSPVSQ